MKHADFVHLHLHTKFSLLDGAIRMESLLEHAQEYRMPALAITDHGNMFGAMEFYQQAMSAGIKPIIGCEAYIAPGSRLDKTTDHRSGDTSYHLILLARNSDGYHNLMKLVSAGFMEGFYYKPRIDHQLLAENSEGLIALSSCLKGEIPRKLLQGDEEGAYQAAARYKEILGPECFYLELQDQGLPEQKKLIPLLREMGRKLEIPLTATNDCHYLDRTHAKAHEVLLCVQTGTTMNDPGRMRLPTDQFYFKPPEEMERLFAEIPEAVRSTVEIAERCNLELEFGRLNLPQYEPPAGYDLDGYLKDLAQKGLEERLADIDHDDGQAALPRETYQKRLHDELEVIARMGFSGYFLIVWDFIDYARRQAIPVGPGRGSAAGSLVAYSLKITDLDPLRYGLLFERFLNPERISPPDIDIDFCQERRDRVIDYVNEKYGRSNVAQIITFGSMMARGVIRDVGRAMEIPYGEVDRIAKLIPNRLNITLKDALQEEPRLRQMLDADEQVRNLLQVAETLEGLTRHASTHAAGVVISPRPLLEMVPLYRGQNDEILTQYDMNGIESLGLLKMDFLGLGTLTLIENTVNIVRRTRGIEVDIDTMPLDDKATYELLSDARTLGVFQLESSGLREILKKLKPETFEDIIALVALYRPGPLGSGMAEDFISRKHGRTQIKYEHPDLEDILEETYGVILYQEQVMQIAGKLAGFSMGTADLLRRAMGKKKPEVMAQQREKFLDGAKAAGVKEKVAEHIFDLMEHFAGYGFNKSHSAAYALVAYRTAYLKANFNVEFMAALLTSVRENTDKVIKYMAECKELSLEVLPPDINQSQSAFTVSGDCIRFGLGGVKNVGENAVQAIIAARGEGDDFESLDDFCSRVDLRVTNRRVVESLIKAGAFDSLGRSRASLFYSLEATMEKAQKHQEDRAQGQGSLFDGLEMASTAGNAPSGEETAEWDQSQLLAFEKEALGFYITGHPLFRYQELLNLHGDCDTQSIHELPDGQNVTIGGVISKAKLTTTRKGDRMAFATLEDLHGSVEVIVFPGVLEGASPYLSGEEPVLISGKVDSGEEEAKLLADSIRALTSENGAKRVHIKLVSIATDLALLEEIKSVLRKHRGQCPVLFHIQFPEKGEVAISASDDLSVSPGSEFVKEVEETVGQGRIHLE